MSPHFQRPSNSNSTSAYLPLDNPFRSPLSPQEWTPESLYNVPMSSSDHSATSDSQSQDINSLSNEIRDVSSISTPAQQDVGVAASVPAAATTPPPAVSIPLRRTPSPTPTTPISPLARTPRPQNRPVVPPTSFVFSPYQFPFQSYPGNPDPGTRLPRFSQSRLPSSRRSSVDSVIATDIDHDIALVRPRAPFMEDTGRRDSSGSDASASLMYRDSVAGNITGGQFNGAPTSPVPRSSSTPNFRAPFLAPSSRPSSSYNWQPPSYSSPSESTAALALPAVLKKPPAPSTRLPTKLEKADKPWIGQKKDARTRGSWWATFLCFLLGVGGSGVLIWRGMATVQLIPQNKLCSVLDDEFTNGISNDTWNYDVELGGFGNGEFQMTTRSGNNIYTKNDQLYIFPTLTSDTLSSASQIFNGGNITLSDCTSTNKTACSATSSFNQSTVLNPVISGRINTLGKASINFGKVEVRAKLPKGDWLWPAIWMLPVNSSKYGPWPIGGEIDIMEARGNAPSYPGQGYNFVRSSLNYGPMDALIRSLTSVISQKRSNYADDFHVYSLEWDTKFMRMYVDSRLLAMLDLQVGKGWWERAGFPATAQNGSATVVVEDPYPAQGGTINAPYDQPFYLVLDLAVGGTSGWFPDTFGNKPWLDGSLTAMRDFARQQPTWFSTWPTNPDDRAFRIDYVKMWKMC